MVVQVMRPGLELLGLQGVRSLGGAELAVLSQQDEVVALIGAPLAPAAEGLVREYYCLWRRVNGLVAASLRPSHAGFFAWLGC